MLLSKVQVEDIASVTLPPARVGERRQFISTIEASDRVILEKDDDLIHVFVDGDYSESIPMGSVIKVWAASPPLTTKPAAKKAVKAA